MGAKAGLPEIRAGPPSVCRLLLSWTENRITSSLGKVVVLSGKRPPDPLSRNCRLAPSLTSFEIIRFPSCLNATPAKTLLLENGIFDESVMYWGHSWPLSRVGKPRARPCGTADTSLCPREGAPSPACPAAAEAARICSFLTQCALHLHPGLPVDCSSQGCSCSRK